MPGRAAREPLSRTLVLSRPFSSVSGKLPPRRSYPSSLACLFSPSLSLWKNKVYSVSRKTRVRATSRSIRNSNTVIEFGQRNRAVARSLEGCRCFLRAANFGTGPIPLRAHALRAYSAESWGHRGRQPSPRILLVREKFPHDRAKDSLGRYSFLSFFLFRFSRLDGRDKEKKEKEKSESYDPIDRNHHATPITRFAVTLIFSVNDAK